MSAMQLALLAVVILVWWAIHSGLLKWMVVYVFISSVGC